MAKAKTKTKSPIAKHNSSPAAKNASKSGNSKPASKVAAKQHSAPKAAKASDKDPKAKKAVEKQPVASKVLAKDTAKTPAIKAPAKPTAPKVSAKKPAKADSKAKGRGKKVEEEDLDDAFLDGDVDGSDIEEYAEELEAVEELDEEIEDDDLTLSSEIKPIDPDEEIYLTDAEGNRYCRSKDCDQIAVVDVYCRYHYLLYWKKIQIRKEILTNGKLEKYVEDLTSRYPDKFLEVIRKDLRSPKDFVAAIQELEIDDAGGDGEFEEETQNYIDEVRGVSEHTGSMDDDEF